MAIIVLFHFCRFCELTFYCGWPIYKICIRILIVCDFRSPTITCSRFITHHRKQLLGTPMPQVFTFRIPNSLTFPTYRPYHVVESVSAKYNVRVTHQPATDLWDKKRRITCQGFPNVPILALCQMQTVFPIAFKIGKYVLCIHFIRIKHHHGQHPQTEHDYCFHLIIFIGTKIGK